MMTRREKQLAWMTAATTTLSMVAFGVALSNATRGTITAEHLRVGDTQGWVTIDATPGGATLEIGSPKGMTRWEVDAEGARATMAFDESKLVIDATGDALRLALTAHGAPIATLEGDASGAQLVLKHRDQDPLVLRLDDSSASFTMRHGQHGLVAIASADRATVGLRAPDARVDMVAQADSAQLTLETTRETLHSESAAIDLTVGRSSAHFGVRVDDTTLDVSIDEELGGRIEAIRGGRPWNLCGYNTEAR